MKVELQFSVVREYLTKKVKDADKAKESEHRTHVENPEKFSRHRVEHQMQITKRNRLEAGMCLVY